MTVCYVTGRYQVTGLLIGNFHLPEGLRVYDTSTAFLICVRRSTRYHVSSMSGWGFTCFAWCVFEIGYIASTAASFPTPRIQRYSSAVMVLIVAY